MEMPDALCRLAGVQSCIECGSDAVGDLCQRCELRAEARQLGAEIRGDAPLLNTMAIESTASPGQVDHVGQRPVLRETRDERTGCPDCRELVKVGANVCRFCGYDIMRRRRRASRVIQAPGKAPAFAAFMSFIWPGAGQIYAGETLTGVTMALAIPAAAVFATLTQVFATALAAHSAVASLAICGVAWGALIFLWAYAFLDAYNAAMRANKAAAKRSGGNIMPSAMISACVGGLAGALAILIWSTAL